jgi:hypothetical protein
MRRLGMEGEDRRGQGRDGELIGDGCRRLIRIGAGEPPPPRNAVQVQAAPIGPGAWRGRRHTS